MLNVLRDIFPAAGLLCAVNAGAQASYRNLDAGFPVRVEDATVTERYALDLDVLNFRHDELSDLRTRFQYEPRVSYGALPRTEMWLRVPLYYRERTITPRGGMGLARMGGAGPAYVLRAALIPPTIASNNPDATTIAAPVGRSIL